MDIATLILAALSVIISAAALFTIISVKNSAASGDNEKLLHELENLKSELKALKEQSESSQSNLRQEINNNINSNMSALGDRLYNAQKDAGKNQSELIGRSSKDTLERIDGIGNSLNKQLRELGDNMSSKQDSYAKAQGERLESISKQMSLENKAQSDRISAMNKNVDEKLRDMKGSVDSQLKQFETRFGTLEKNTEQKLDGIRQTVEGRLDKIAQDNNAQLDKIRGTVDEKLQKTLEEKMNSSFKLVSERLEQVYKGLGEMQNIAQGVGDLKNVLSNVKTRGILGEIQLGTILSEILAPEQYAENIATVQGSTERVEFAVRLPGSSDGKSVWLPIDSKFNADKYMKLQSAYESGNKDDILAAKKELAAAIRKNAKDIREKYVSVPDTTSFAIMFLPFEGLYAEVVSGGLVEELQHEFSVNIAGPSTMAAMLNSLQMGFRTLAIQKRSDEVWKTLSAVKTEFVKFEDAILATQKRLHQADSELENLVGTRTRAINRKLKEVETLDPSESYDLLGE